MPRIAGEALDADDRGRGIAVWDHGFGSAGCRRRGGSLQGRRSSWEVRRAAGGERGAGERARSPHEVGLGDPSGAAENPNATIVVPVGATEMGLRPAAAASRDVVSAAPRLRSGWALKRLDDEVDHERYVAPWDLREGTFMRMSEQDAQLVELLDGKRSVAELLVEASERLGPSGAGRLARLVADFGERGMLDGVAPTPVLQEEPGFFARAFKTRERTFGWIPEYFQTAYRHWGRLFFSPLMVTCLVLLSLAGLVVFSYLVGARYGTPFVVAHRVVLGGLVFLAGRFAIVMVHELAHRSRAHPLRTDD